MKGGISWGSHKNNLAYERDKTLIFFYYHWIYNIEVKSHNAYIKNHSNTKTADSLTLTNVSFITQKLNERRREIIFWQPSYKIKI